MDNFRERRQPIPKTLKNLDRDLSISHSRKTIGKIMYGEEFDIANKYMLSNERHLGTLIFPTFVACRRLFLY